MSNDADQKVERLVLARFLEDEEGAADYTVAGHLVKCPSLRVWDAEGRDGSYGCDTGCEYVTLEADLVCGHEGFEYTYTYGTFGDLDSLLEDLLEMENEPSFKDWLALRDAAVKE